MHIYYSIIDPYPAYRADLAELFGVELRALGLTTEWFMAAVGEQVGNASAYAGQLVHTPAKVAGEHRLLTKFRYIGADLRHMFGLLFRRVDAIQCRDKYVASIAGLVVARIRRVPFIYWCSYPFPEHGRLVAEGKRGWRRRVAIALALLRFFLLYKLICRAATHVFVQSERMKEEMHRYGVPLSKMTPVPMGVSARIGNWRQTNRTLVDPMRVVYAGTLAAVRRLEVLLDAFAIVVKHIPAAKLEFVGEGDYPGERLVLEAHAARLGLSSSVTFVGFVPMEEAWARSASAAVCLSPICPNPVLAVASSTKMVEYLALGRPVVCNDHPEQSQVIAESGAGICVQWAAAAFADAIVHLLSHPAEAAAMGSRGPAWVAEHRTYPAIAKAVWRKYQSLLNEARG